MTWNIFSHSSEESTTVCLPTLNKNLKILKCVIVIPFPCHFPFVSTAIFPDLIISNNITLGIFSLSICFWWSRLHSFSLWSTLFVIETRRSCPPCWVRKSTRGFCPNSPRFPFRHSLQEFPAQLSIQVVLFLLSEGQFTATRKTSANTQ